MVKKEEYTFNGKTIIRIVDINPWEFRGYYKNQEGLNFTFQYKNVKRKEE